jgi:hypothetical protein
MFGDLICDSAFVHSNAQVRFESHSRHPQRCGAHHDASWRRNCSISRHSAIHGVFRKYRHSADQLGCRNALEPVGEPIVPPVTPDRNVGEDFPRFHLLCIFANGFIGEILPELRLPSRRMEEISRGNLQRHDGARKLRYNLGRGRKLQ